MTQIEVDFDVYKELTMRRKTEATSYNDVIRELLKLPAIESGGVRLMLAKGPGWVQKGWTFPNGTEFRATYKGETHLAHVVSNRMILNGKAMNSFSEAATEITGNSVNGWKFWEYRSPGDTKWSLAADVKK